MARRRLSRWMHRGEEGDDRVALRGAEVLAVSGHIAAALNYLPNDLIGREPRRGVVECRPPHPALTAERVTVAALLALEEERALELQRSTAFDVIDRRWSRAPRVHHRRPWRESPEPGKGTDQRHGEDNDHDREGPSSPTFLAGSRNEGQGEEQADH